MLGLPSGCLSDDFVIMIDDAERSGEGRMQAEMEKHLNVANIPYRRGRYSGVKDCALIVAERLDFLASM